MMMELLLPLFPVFCLRKKNGCEKDSFRALIWDVVDGRRVQEFSRLDFGLLVNFKLRKDLKNNKIMIVYYDIMREMTRRFIILLRRDKSLRVRLSSLPLYPDELANHR